MEDLLDLTMKLGSLVAWPAAGTSGRLASAHGPAGDLAIDIVTGPDELDRLADEHRRLEARSPHPLTPFQTHDFLSAWARRFSPAAPLRLLALRHGGELVMSLPLVERRTPFGRVAEVAGRPLCQYADAALAWRSLPADWLAHALAQLQVRYGIGAVVFHNVRRDAAIAPFLRAHARQVGASDRAPGLQLDRLRGSESLQDTHRSLARQNRRTVRRLEKLGEVGFETLRGGEEAVALLHEAVAMKEAWLAERGRAGRAFADPRTLQCLEDLVRGGGAGAVVSRLTLDGQPVAIEVGFLHRDHYCAYLGAFSGEMSRYGVGKLQIERTIEDLVEQGAKTYDLLAPADDYKQEWADHSVPVADHVVVLSPRGALAAAVRVRGPQILKSVFERLPRGVRIRLRGLARQA